MKDYTNYHTSYKDMIQKSAESTFNLYKKGFEHTLGILNGELEIEFLLKQHTNRFEETKEDRQVYCLKDVDIKRGDYITIEDEVWIIVTDIDFNGVFKFCKVRKCNNEIYWLDNSNILSAPIIITNLTLYTDGITNGNLKIQDGNATMVMQFNDKTKTITHNSKFIIDHNRECVFSVADIDSYSKNGLLTLVCAKEQYNPTKDNLELNIANYYNNVVTNNTNIPIEGEKSVIISGSDSIKLSRTATYNSQFIDIDGTVYLEESHWTITDLLGGATNAIQIIGVDNNSIKIKAVDSYENIGKEFYLSCSSIDGVINSKKKVKITSL